MPISFLISEDPFAKDAFVPPLSVPFLTSGSKSIATGEGESKRRKRRRQNTASSIPTLASISEPSHSIASFSQEKQSSEGFHASSRQRSRHTSVPLRCSTQQQHNQSTLESSLANLSISNCPSSRFFGSSPSTKSNLELSSKSNMKLRPLLRLSTIFNEDRNGQDKSLEQYQPRSPRKLRKQNHVREWNGKGSVVRPQPPNESRDLESPASFLGINPNTRLEVVKEMAGDDFTTCTDFSDALGAALYAAAISTPASSFSEDSSPYPSSFLHLDDEDDVMQGNNSFVLDTNIPHTPFNPFGDGLDKIDGVVISSTGTRRGDFDPSPKHYAPFAHVSLHPPVRLPFPSGLTPPARPPRRFVPRNSPSERSPIRMSSFHSSLIDLPPRRSFSTPVFDNERSGASEGYNWSGSAVSTTSSGDEGEPVTGHKKTKMGRGRVYGQGLQRGIIEEASDRSMDSLSEYSANNDSQAKERKMGEEFIKNKMTPGIAYAENQKERRPLLERVRTATGVRTETNGSSKGDLVSGRDDKRSSRFINRVVRKFKLGNSSR